MDTRAATSKADDYRKQVGNLVSGEYTDDPRTLLLIAHTDLVIDHHAAIMLLLREGHYGSAFSLVRIQFEAFINAHWVMGCATDDQVRKIAAKEFHLPRMGDRVTGCDSAFGTDQFFQTIKNAGWEAMNSYTHSGIRQLTRRFKDGKVEPNYSDAELKEVINGTTMIVFLTAKLFCTLVGRQKEAKEVEVLITEFAAGT